jgi:hypothetical protein
MFINETDECYFNEEGSFKKLFDYQESPTIKNQCLFGEIAY